MNRTGIVTQKIDLQVPDSPPMAAYVARPRGNGPHPGLLVFQEAFGVNAHIRDVAERCAEQGYVALAPELYHRTAPPGFEASYADFASITPHYLAVTPAAAEADLRASYDSLHSNSQVKPDEISCLGFCLGGRVSFIADSVLPLRAAVSFYGGGIAPDLLDRTAKLAGPMLFIWGGLDKRITPEHRRAVADSLSTHHKPFVASEFSPADHGFFCDQRPSYDARSARQAWALTLEFLRP
jgi:carboxymethylenebutenolidase